MSERSPIPNLKALNELEIQLLEKSPNLFNGVSNRKKTKILHSLKDLINIEVR